MNNLFQKNVKNVVKHPQINSQAKVKDVVAQSLATALTTNAALLIIIAHACPFFNAAPQVIVLYINVVRFEKILQFAFLLPFEIPLPKIEKAPDGKFDDINAVSPL